MTRHLKLAAAVLAVLLTISGFAPAGSKSHSRSRSSSSHGHGGGGCSSSHSTSHNYKHHHHDDDDDSVTSGGTSGSTSSSKRVRKPTTRVLSCATTKHPRSLVELHSTMGYTKQWVVSVNFLSDSGDVVDTGSAEVDVPGHDEATASVAMSDPSKAAQVSSCRVLNVHARY
jgi:hypothetical protein